MFRSTLKTQMSFRWTVRMLNSLESARCILQPLKQCNLLENNNNQNNPLCQTISKNPFESLMLHFDLICTNNSLKNSTQISRFSLNLHQKKWEKYLEMNWRHHTFFQVSGYKSFCSAVNWNFSFFYYYYT